MVLFHMKNRVCVIYYAHDRGNIALACKRIYTSVTAKELGLNNNSSTDTYNKINKLPANDIIDKNVKDLNIKFGIYKIPIGFDCLTCIRCLRCIKPY